MKICDGTVGLRDVLLFRNVCVVFYIAFLSRNFFCRFLAKIILKINILMLQSGCWYHEVVLPLVSGELRCAWVRVLLWMNNFCKFASVLTCNVQLPASFFLQGLWLLSDWMISAGCDVSSGQTYVNSEVLIRLVGPAVLSLQEEQTNPFLIIIV